MKPKVKSIFFIIWMHFIYGLGITTLLVPLFFMLHCSFALSNFIATVVFSIPFLYLLYKKTGISFTDRKTPDESTRFPLWRLLCIGILLAATAQIYVHLFPSFEKENVNLTKMDITFSAMSNLLAAPIAEELFGRKWAVSYLERANVKPVHILVITSFLFFIFHTSYTPLYFRFDTLLSGAVLCYIYIRCRDVRYCIFIHFIMNLIATSIFFANH